MVAKYVESYMTMVYGNQQYARKFGILTIYNTLTVLPMFKMRLN